MSLLGGTPLWQIAFNVGMTEIFTVCWLIAACVHSTYKWGYYTIGIGAAIVVCISLMTTTFNLVKARGKDVSNVFITFMSVIMFLWLIAYPTCFGITDGGNVLQPDSATIFYGLIFDEEPAEHVGPVAERRCTSPASFKSSDSDSSIKEKLKLKKKHKKDKKKAKEG
ncbi:Protein yro2 [Fusarium falciforme]|nr:Protein yro2 [Fusarium falciforme]